MPVLDTVRPVGVVGAGTMGAGIAQVAALAGHRTLVVDAVDGAAAAAVERAAAALARLVEKGRLGADDATAATARLVAVGSLAELAECGLVVEAVAEDLAAKRTLFAGLEEHVADDAVLATNTSSLSVTAVAGRLRRPERVAGLHFFNPAPVMRLVEVVRGDATAGWTLDLLLATASAWGKTPVVVTSTPGFVVNRVARPYYGEAQRLVESGAADPATVDALLREGAGFPMGPFELTDLVGQDVNLAVSRAVWEQTFHDPRYAPTVMQQRLVDAGRLGRKSGRGLYDYAEGSARDLPAAEPERVAAVEPPRMLVTDGRTAAALEAACGEPVVVSDWATTGRVAVAASPGCDDAHRDAAVAVLQADGLTVSVVADVAGLVVARTLSMLVNEAADLVARGEATPDDVDTAMRLGAGYPRGPLAWGDELGPARVVTLLEHLHADTPTGRYRVSPALRAAALVGRSLRD